MSVLDDKRHELAALLTGKISDVTAFSEFPESVTPPFIAVGPGDPYLEFEGATFGSCLARHFATFVTDVGTNDVRASELDDAILTIVKTIDESGDFVVTRVDQPGQISINGQSCLGVSVLTLTSIDL